LQHPQTLICEINGVKVDFIRFRYKIIRPLFVEKGIRMLSVDDIAPMKLDAITGRGRKKDFYDLYFLLKRYSIEQLFSLYLEKYPHQTTFHVARSMSYFVDAEADADPIVFQKNLTWQMVKDGIVKEIRKL
jgi:predicted nucleotidyltransferase component of viral defense system